MIYGHKKKKKMENLNCHLFLNNLNSVIKYFNFPQTFIVQYL